jgi:hypothetical protein
MHGIKALIGSFLMMLIINPSVIAQPWRPLFDGQSFDGWVAQNGNPIEGKGWQVQDGMLHLDRSQGQGGNLLTEREYGNFELVFEWKVAPQANNGIKYRVQEFDGRTLGLEYQVIDDSLLPKLSPNHKTGAIYDIVAVREHDVLRPAGEFNRGRIVVSGNHIEHWLNGQLVAETQVGSKDWDERIAQSKFADVAGFGRNQFGRIMLTDHNDEVWYRNVFIREWPIARSPVLAARESVPPGRALHGCTSQARRRPLRRLFRCR